MTKASAHKGDGGHGGHSHGAGLTNEKKLTIALVLTGGFLMVEVIGGIVTPTPDVFNMTLMSIPIYLLYELGILGAWIFGRKKDVDGAKPATES